MPLSILFENDDLVAVNKPAGIASHGPDSLETAVRAYLEPKLPPSLSFRPGPLHRLDKPTSGVIVFSASLAGAREFSEMLRERRVVKTYLAILEGDITAEETWEDTLIRDRENGVSTINHEPHKPHEQEYLRAEDGPKAAVTTIWPLARGKDNGGAVTLAAAVIHTGRTHQIRAQAAAHGHPLTGDGKYGSGGKGPFYLHAWKLEGLPPPLPPAITAPLPAAFTRKIAALFPDFAGVPL